MPWRLAVHGDLPKFRPRRYHAVFQRLEIQEHPLSLEPGGGKSDEAPERLRACSHPSA